MDVWDEQKDAREKKKKKKKKRNALGFHMPQLMFVSLGLFLYFLTYSSLLQMELTSYASKNLVQCSDGVATWARPVCYVPGNHGN